MINDPNAIDDVVIANLKQRARRKNRDGRKWDHWITMPNALFRRYQGGFGKSMMRASTRQLINVLVQSFIWYQIVAFSAPRLARSNTCQAPSAPRQPATASHVSSSRLESQNPLISSALPSHVIKVI